MKALSGKNFAKVLENHGWKRARVQGSHHVFIKENRVERISLPIHGNQAIKVGLLKHLMKVAGLKETDL
jgi:predicted RNA binding protein YcfA (HicA-like mRNA interferase family)